MTTNIKNQQIHINHLITYPALISIGLLVARILYSQSYLFIFFAWNLFLALIPFFVSLRILAFTQKNANKKRTPWLLLFIWLLFLPNAPYLVTDLIHLRIRTGAPFWFDILLITSFCWNGLIIGFISIYNVHEVLKQKKSELISWGCILAVIVMCAFGIYLGRFLRWNSWDLIVNPLDIIYDIFQRIIHPIRHIRTWGITFSYSLFLIVGYLTIRSLIGWRIPNYSREN